jgi:hypothetical protein
VTFDDIKRMIEDLRARGEEEAAEHLREVAEPRRRMLPFRRPAERCEMWFRGRLYIVGVGRFENGALAEVFIDAIKQSTDGADDARDAALALSLALQYGCPAATIRNAATRDAKGAPAGIIGACLDMLAEFETEAAQ